MNFWIAVDDLRVGGIQRLCLDESYELESLGHKVRIFCARQSEGQDSILEIDREMSNRLPEISFLPNSKLRSIGYLSKQISLHKVKSVVCHSPTTAILFRISSLLTGKDLDISLWIHQVLSFSSRGQAIKRILYAIAADTLFFSAIQFRKEWERHWLDQIVKRVRGNQRRITTRLGISARRLSQYQEKFSCNIHKNHVVFTARSTAWKGLEDFLDIVNRNGDLAGIILTVNLSEDQMTRIDDEKLRSRIHFLESKSPGVLSDQHHLLHIYPTKYGRYVKNPQSIGLNVLEFAAMGIPSLVSREEYSTYPELYNCGLVMSADWTNRRYVDQVIRQTLANSEKMSGKIPEEVLKVIGIQDHVGTIITTSAQKGD